MYDERNRPVKFLILDQEFGVPAVSGNYVFFRWVDPVGPDTPGSLRIEPIYIGTSNDLFARLAHHERWDDAVRAGATDVAARFVHHRADRISEEESLIRHNKPKLNTIYRDPRQDLPPQFRIAAGKDIGYLMPKRQVLAEATARSSMALVIGK